VQFGEKVGKKRVFSGKSPTEFGIGVKKVVDTLEKSYFFPKKRVFSGFDNSHE
jgi:hypothetical protein